jgi:uncharacterized coiled-coil DUF342 family protein
MNDTPETDASIIERRHIHKSDGSVQLVELIDAEFARRLERERDEWAAMCGRYKQERDDLQKAINGLCEHFKISPANTTLLAVEVLRIERERDEARDKYDALATEHMLAVNKLCEERDEARAEIQRLRLDAQKEAEHHDRMVKELEELYDKLKS